MRRPLAHARGATTARRGVLAVWLLGAVVAAAAQAPVIQNGRAETRQATSIASSLAALTRSSNPTWLGWRAPMVSGDRDACSTWSNGDAVIRGALLEQRLGDDGRPRVSASSTTARLESGTFVVVLLRVVDGRVERLRAIGDDCPIDGNGQTVQWLEGITPAESLRYLTTLALPSLLTTDGKRLASSALLAAALHRDPGADTLLDRAIAADADSDGRIVAARQLATLRGAHGFDQVTRAIAGEHDASVRRRFVTALAASQETAAAGALLAIARTDAASSVRAEAVYGYAGLAGADGIAQVVDIATRETNADVQRRAVDGLSRVPHQAGVPALLAMARASDNLTLRKAATGALGRADDPRALAYLEEIVAR